MQEFQIKSRRGVDSPLKENGLTVLRGETEWLVSGNQDALKEMAAELGNLAEVIGNTLLLRFGNAVGYFQIPRLGLVEVRSGKWTREVFDSMLRELTEVGTRLPFAATAAASLPYDRSVVVRHDVLYHIFAYLRDLFHTEISEDQIEPALRGILADPHRLLVRERQSVDLAAARRVDSQTVEDLVSGVGGLTAARTRLSGRFEGLAALKGYLPESVTETRCRTTVDTAENRFVKVFLEMAAGVFEQMAEVCRSASEGTAFSRRTYAEAVALRKRIEPFLRASLWREVGPMTHLPAGSTTLQRRRGYRDVFRHFAKLRLAARLPLGPDLVRRLLDARDIAELYELWCFFRVVSALEEILGPPSAAFTPEVNKTQVHVPYDLGVSWREGPTAWYNRTYYPGAKKQERQSYSLILRPDIALSISEGPNSGLHFFDAKFKVDSFGTTGIPEEEIEAEERQGKFLRGDLYKMHTYRDAIPSARSVWVLYPGSEVSFYSDNGERWKGGMAIPVVFSGVGAVPLVPPTSATSGSDKSSRLKEVLVALLQTGESVVDERRASKK